MSTKSVSFYLDEELKRIMSPEAKGFLLEDWYRRMYPHIPFQSGILADDVSIEKDGIHFKSPQARYLYYGELYVDPITGKGAFYNPDTGQYWSRPNTQKVPSGKPLNFSHEQHPQACAKWGEVAASLYGEVIVRDLKNYLYRK